MTFPQASPLISEWVENLVAKLVLTPIGDIISYTELNAPSQYVLQKARFEAERQSGSIFAVVRGVGFRRLPAPEAVSVGVQAIGKIRRTAKRSLSRLHNVSGNLDQTTSERLTATKSHLGAIASIATMTKTRKLVENVPENHQLPIGRTLQILAK